MSATPEWQYVPPPPGGRSTFVTVVAWIFIGLSACTALAGIVEAIVMHFIFSMPNAPSLAQMQQHLLPGFGTVLANAQWYLLAFIAAGVAMLIASIGLLRRRNWARLLFIALLVLRVIVLVGGIVLQQWMLASMFDFERTLHPNAQEEAALQGMTAVVRIFSAIFTIGFIALYGWIIHRLRSRAIVAEFS